jgi:hypothetical protein
MMGAENRSRHLRDHSNKSVFVASWLPLSHDQGDVVVVITGIEYALDHSQHAAAVSIVAVFASRDSGVQNQISDSRQNSSEAFQAVIFLRIFNFAAGLAVM